MTSAFCRLASRSSWCLGGLALTVVAAGLTLSAQAPDGGRGRAPTAPAQAPAGGRAGGGGRGGGAQKDAPVNAGVDWTKQPSVLPKRPAEELENLILQPGYRLELVLADPQITDPTSITFDGNGRMYVLENPGYMANKEAEGELDPVGRISRWTDADNDGVYDAHTVFVDHLVFPRFVTPYGPDTILTKESNASEVWKYTDTNGDGVADRKELFGTGYGRIDNVEQEEASLTWALDNWLYDTFNSFRSRMTPGGVVKEKIGSNQGAEWGLTQDDDGKVWYLEGSNGVPTYWQFPIVYGNYRVPDELDPDVRTPWGAPVLVADMQGGMGIVRMPDGSSAQTTSGAGGVIIRGHRLPKDLQGDYCYGEPVARMVRCMYQEKVEGMTHLHTLTPHDEFIKSKDPFFRPVDQKIAPDGTLYIVDMYHGIVQERQWSGPGSYIRARIEQYRPRPGRALRSHLAARLRRHRAVACGAAPSGPDRAAHEQRDVGPARDAPVASERLVARHRAADARAERRQVRRPGPAGARENVAEPPRALPCAVDARRAGRTRRAAGAPDDGGSRTADAHPGDPRQRDALQGR